MKTIDQVYAVEAIRITDSGEPELAHIQCVEHEDQIEDVFGSWYQNDNKLLPVVEKVWLQ